MKPFSEFRPSGFDHHVKVADDERDYEVWWVVPTTRNRDSDAWEESNFEAALKRLGGESHNVAVLRFGHWACGWFEVILVRPDTDAYRVAEQVESSLENYPLLDETDVGARECEEAYRALDHYAARELAEQLDCGEQARRYLGDHTMVLVDLGADWEHDGHAPNWRWSRVPSRERIARAIRAARKRLCDPECAP